MSRKLISDISANTVQIVVNQVSGVVIFFLTSRYLDKSVYGELNWSLATATMLLSALSLGIDLIILKKIASGGDARQTAGLYFTHTLVSGTSIAILLAMAYLLFPAAYAAHTLLPALLAAQLFTFFASPFKQLANGRREFKRLAVFSTLSNLVKTALLLFCLLTDRFTVNHVVLIFIAGGVAEFAAGLWLNRKIAGPPLFPLYWNIRQYRSLVKESLPQFGVNVFNIVLARFDWFVLGVLASTIATAEYSFAYKVVELSRLPLLILSPVLVPIFVNVFSRPAIEQETVNKLRLLFRAEMFIAVLLPIILISCWTPLMDMLTQHKYGRSNEAVFIILCCSVPLQFVTDYYWNLCFAQHQLRLTFIVAACSSIVNMLLNLSLVPVYGATGAAIAWVVCFVVQLVLFKIYTRQHVVKPDLSLLLKSLVCAAAALFIIKGIIPGQPVLTVIAASGLYFLLAVLCGLISVRQVRAMTQQFLHNK